MEIPPHTKKVLLISHSNSLGGAELCFVETIKALKSSGYEISVVLPKITGGKLPDLCEDLVEEIYYQFLPFWMGDRKCSFKEKWNNLRVIIPAVWKSVKLIKKIKPDIVITNTSVIPEYGIATKLMGTKHIWFIHELVEEDFDQKYIFGKSFSLKMISCLSDIVIVNSVFVANVYKKMLKDKKMKLLYQPATIQMLVQKEEKKDTELKLLIVGQVAEHKGQHEAIEATLKLLRKGKNVSLTILGGQDINSSYMQNIKAMIVDDVRDKFYFIPFSSTPEKYYAEADMLLVCSRCEALGRISIEGMKVGLPIVASNRGGNLELVRDGFNGYLYEYGNPADLADKILQLQNVEVRKTFGENGKKWAEEHFNEEKFKNGLDEIVKLL